MDFRFFVPIEIEKVAVLTGLLGLQVFVVGLRIKSLKVLLSFYLDSEGEAHSVVTVKLFEGIIGVEFGVFVFLSGLGLWNFIERRFIEVLGVSIILINYC